MIPVPKRLRQSPAYHAAPKQERDAARRLGGRTTPASGSKELKGDVQVKRKLRLECKNTEADSFRVTREMILKIEAAALSSGELPAIEITLRARNRGERALTVAIVPTYVLDMMVAEEPQPPPSPSPDS